MLEVDSIGEVFGYFLDKNRISIDHLINKRFMGADLSHFKQIPIKVVASSGVQKVPIIKTVLRAGYANILVTDELTARAVYDE